MKKLSFVFFLLFATLLNAQNESLVNNQFTNQTQFLFNKYLDADITLKNGDFTITKINYNICFQEIWYQDGEKYLKLKDLEKIDLIETNNYKFLVINGLIYQNLLNSNGYKILKYREIDSQSAQKDNGGYGASTVTSSTKSITSYISQSNGINNVNSIDDSDIKFDLNTRYFIANKDGKLHSLTKRKLYKLFENKKALIKDYINNNDISLKDDKDIIKLFNYIAS